MIVFGLKIKRTYRDTQSLYTQTIGHYDMYDNKDGSDRIARWHLAVADFNIRIESLPGRENSLAEVLS